MTRMWESVQVPQKTRQRARVKLSRVFSCRILEFLPVFVCLCGAYKFQFLIHKNFFNWKPGSFVICEILLTCVWCVKFLVLFCVSVAGANLTRTGFKKKIYNVNVKGKRQTKNLSNLFHFLCIFKQKGVYF